MSTRSVNSALFLAIETGDKNVLEMLLEKGADVNSKDLADFTPLHYAAGMGNKEIFEILLGNGADVNAKTNGLTPLHVAVQKDKSMVEKLLEKGADINAKDIDGLTSLHLANDEKIVALLIEKGANINAKTSRGKTPLYEATIHYTKDVVELLLEKGANVNAKTLCGKTSLYMATLHSRKDVVEILLEKGAEYNTKSILEELLLEKAANSSARIMSVDDSSNIRHRYMDVDYIDCIETIIKYAILRNPNEKINEIVKIAKLSGFWNICKNPVKKLLCTNNIWLDRFLQETIRNKLAGFLFNKNAGLWEELKKIKKIPIYCSMIGYHLNTATK